MQKMADEDVDLDKVDKEIEGENRVEKRIKDLSDKVKLTAGERDELKRLADQKDAENASLKRDNDFLNSFGDVLGKHPEASSYRDAIREKVLKGYSVEDATVSTLASEGKLSFPKKEVKVDNVAGGSAVNQQVSGGEKPISELSREEKRARLMEAETRGEISAN